MAENKDWVVPGAIPVFPQPEQGTGDVGDLFGGVGAGFLGFPADIVQLIAMGANRPPGASTPEIPFGSEWLGETLGADTESDAFIAGLFGAPDPFDIARISAHLGVGLLGHTLFHGTPHKFDKFDLSRIGTGEGAQAYGHGLYFAESPGVAGSYRDALGGRSVRIGGEDIDMDLVDVPTHNAVSSVLGAIKGAPPGTKVGDDVLQILQNKQKPGTPVYEVFERMRRDGVEAITQGHLYEVEIPDEITAKMLDWDAPLSEQPKEVQQALANLGETPADYDAAIKQWEDALKRPRTGRMASEHYEQTVKDRIETLRRKKDHAEMMTGEQFYNRLIGMNGDKVAASEALREAGIPGIRFYDAQSRVKPQVDPALRMKIDGLKEQIQASKQKGWTDSIPELESQLAKAEKELASEGTRNIVLFNPDDITQVKRDGEVVFKAPTTSGVGATKTALREAVVSDNATELQHCYDNSFRVILDTIDTVPDDNLNLVHGTVTNAEGRSFPHAWVEMKVNDEWIAIDAGRNPDDPIKMGRDKFRETLNAKDITEYPPEKALVTGARAGHYGPWDTKPTASGVDDQGRVVAKTVGTQDDFQVRQQRQLVEAMRTEVADRKKYGDSFKTAEKQLGVEERRLAKMEAALKPTTSGKTPLEEVMEIVDKY